MRSVENIQPLIKELLPENDKVLFNLFYLIAESERAFWATDDRSYLIGQTSENLPMWIWLGEHVDETARQEIERVVVERLALNPELKITADAEKIEPILQKISGGGNVRYEKQVPMVVYRCDKVENPKKAAGHMVYSTEEHKGILAQFITGMVADLEKRPMREGEAEGFAEGTAGSEDLYLWEDEKQVVAMAMIVHRTEEFARINTVYTDAGQRGKGYAGMLVGAVTQKILDEHRIPMLYTEKDNICSNAVYRRIGYQMCGELTQFLFG